MHIHTCHVRSCRVIPNHSMLISRASGARGDRASRLGAVEVHDDAPVGGAPEGVTVGEAGRPPERFNTYQFEGDFSNIIIKCIHLL